MAKPKHSDGKRPRALIQVGRIEHEYDSDVN